MCVQAQLLWHDGLLNHVVRLYKQPAANGMLDCLVFQFDDILL